MMAFRILVKGKVQGVYFRASAAKMAEQFFISGHAKNLKSGDVEIHAQGEKEQLELFIDWCWKGPLNAKVKDVLVEETTVLPLNDFKTY